MRLVFAAFVLATPGEGERGYVWKHKRSCLKNRGIKKELPLGIQASNFMSHVELTMVNPPRYGKQTDSS